MFILQRSVYCRLLVEIGLKVIFVLGPYNLISASCQTYIDEFLKQLGSSGYMMYVKTAKTAAVVGGIVGIAVGIVGVAAALFSGSLKDAYDKGSNEYEEDDE